MRLVVRLIGLVLIGALAGDSPMLLAQRQTGPNGGGRPGAPDGRGRQSGPPGRGNPNRDGGPALTVGNSSIRGRVLSATAGMPVRRASVQAVLSADGRRGEAPRSVLTDDNGSFELRDLPAGRWTLTVSKTGFIQQRFGQKSAFASSDLIVLAEGQQFTADFKLSRGGAISGRLTDELGEPLAGASVAAMRLQKTFDGVRLARTGTSVPSDDNGSYRIYGLPPGQYYVSVADSSPAGVFFSGSAEFATALRVESQASFNEQLESLVSRSAAGGLGSYAPTYYPGTANVADAQPITLAVGEEQLGINLSVVPTRAARISGRISGANGQPVQATVALSETAANVIPNGGRTRSGPDGTFTLTNIPPGTYTLDVLGPNVGAVPAEVATMPLTVSGSDILGLNIVTGPGATVIGTVVADSGGRLPAARMSVTATPARTSAASFTARGEVGASGTFELTGLLGVYNLRFASLPAGWSIKSITANGLDVSDAALEFRPGDRVAVRVELTDRITQLSGTVRTDRELRGSYVVVLPDEASKWTNSSRFIRIARVADDGQFLVSGLPPYSRYLALAIDYLEEGDQQSPEFLKRAKASARASFALSEGEQKTLDLPLSVR